MGMYRVAVVGTYAGQTTTNSMGWQIQESFPGLSAVGIADAIGQEWKNRICPVLSDGYSLTGVLAYSVEDPSIGASVPVSATGGIAGARLPSFVAAKVKIVTGLRGRSFAGRTGLPGIPEGYTDADSPNRLTTTAKDTLQGAFNNFVLNTEARFSSSADLDLGVISEFSGKQKRPQPIFTAGIDYVVDMALGSRVSRLR